MKNFKKLLFLAGIGLLFAGSSEVLACTRSKIAKQEAERQNRENLKMNNIKNMINEKKDIFLEKIEGFKANVNEELDDVEQRIAAVHGKVVNFNNNHNNAKKEGMGYGTYACIVGGVCATGVAGYYLIKYIRK